MTTQNKYPNIKEVKSYEVTYLCGHKEIFSKKNKSTLINLTKIVCRDCVKEMNDFRFEIGVID